MKIINRTAFLAIFAAVITQSFANPSVTFTKAAGSAQADNACRGEFKSLPKYCYPIHASVNLDRTQILQVRYGDDPVAFYLKPGQTGFATANQPIQELLTVTYYYKKYKKYERVKVIYKEESLGENYQGLSCDASECSAWRQ